MSRFVDVTEYFGKGQPFPRIRIARDAVVDFMIAGDDENKYRVGMSIINRTEPLFTVDDYADLASAEEVADVLETLFQ
jgi:hypothetical protein